MQECIAPPPQQGGQPVPVLVHQPEDPVVLRLFLLLPLVLHELHRRLLQFEAVNATGDVEQLLLKVAKVGLDSKGEFPFIVDGMDTAQVFKEDRPIRAALSVECFYEEDKNRTEGEPGQQGLLRKRGKLSVDRSWWSCSTALPQSGLMATLEAAVNVTKNIRSS